MKCLQTTDDQNRRINYLNHARDSVEKASRQLAGFGYLSWRSTAANAFRGELEVVRAQMVQLDSYIAEIWHPLTQHHQAENGARLLLENGGMIQ